MNARDDGGPAFPAGAPHASYSSGMTLRDYFAAKALPALVQREFVSGSYKHICPQSARTAAVEAYEIADAMLAERAKVSP